MTFIYSYFRKKTQMADRMAKLTGSSLPDFQFPYAMNAANGQNGRVNLQSEQGATGYTVPDAAGFAHPTQTEINFAGDMLRGNWEHTPLSNAFFTRSNATRIQRDLKQSVYRMSGPKKYIIDDQDVDELKMIMRAMYLQYAKNETFNIEGQINELNKLVIDWAAPRIMSEISQYNYYLNDISHLPIPLEKPLNMSSAGTKSLPFQKPM
jgi:hypothetical protein